MCNFCSCRYRGPSESSIDGVEEAVVNEHVEDDMEGTGLQLTPIRPLFKSSIDGVVRAVWRQLGNIITWKIKTKAKPPDTLKTPTSHNIFE